MSGPLAGIKVVELGGIGPGPFAGMVLSDLGAEVVRIDRTEPGDTADHEQPDRDVMLRGRRSIAVDLKSRSGVESALRLLERADVLIDPFRPGVAERLGLGPDVALARNPRLVYGRMTGWGQTGPLAHAAGHDINYTALSGPLAAMGRADSAPAPALNLVGDFGGGAMFLLVGILSALLERETSGLGQVIDAAMVDGSAMLFASIVGFMGMGVWTEKRQDNLLDGGAPYYDCYGTSDGKFISIGPLEPKFYAQLLALLGLDPEQWPQNDKNRWPELKSMLSAIFATRTRDQWCEQLEGTDVCFAPVLPMREAAVHPHLAARNTYVEDFGLVQPAPAPRFSRTPAAIAAPPSLPGSHSRDVLTDWGFGEDEVDALIAEGAVACAPVETR